MNLAKRIRDCRYAKGWGPDELATRAEISRTALYQIESGKTELPRAGTLRRIARALDVSIDLLLGNAEVGTFDLPSFAKAAPGTGRRPGWSITEETSRTTTLARPAEEPFSASDSDEAGPSLGTWMAPPRQRDLARKFHELLESPLGEGVALIVEESHRLLPATQAKRLG